MIYLIFFSDSFLFDIQKLFICKLDNFNKKVILSLICKENKSFLEIICEDNHKIEISNALMKYHIFYLMNVMIY